MTSVDAAGTVIIIESERIHPNIPVEFIVETEYDRALLHERLSKLSGGLAVIKVGAKTEMELKESKLSVKAVVKGV